MSDLSKEIRALIEDGDQVFLVEDVERLVDEIERLTDTERYLGTALEEAIKERAEFIERIAELEAGREHWYCELCGCESCIKAEALSNSEGEK